MHVGLLAHLLSYAPGYRQAGVSRYIARLLAHLPNSMPADRLTVFASNAARPGAHELPEALNWAWSRWPTAQPLARIAWEQSVAPLALRRAGVDLVHAPVNVAPLLAGSPAVVTVHDLAFLHFPDQYPGAKQCYLNLLTRRSVERATRVIAVSEHTRQDVLRCYGVAPERVVTVPNGVDAGLGLVTDEARLAALRRQHGLDGPFILFVGTLQPRKNLLGLLRAFARVPRHVAERLVVVGAKGWSYEPIFAEARALDLLDRVVFAGYADAPALAAWYSAATAFVYPSLYEGFGLPVLEAMACGAPVITSSTSSLPEVAGDAALLVDPTDVGALAAAIERVLTDPELRAALRRRGFARARTFSWQRTADETAAVYRAALGVTVPAEVAGAIERG